MHGIKAISHSRRVVDISAPIDRESFDVVRAPGVNHLTGLGSLMAQPQVAPWQSAHSAGSKELRQGRVSSAARALIWDFGGEVDLGRGVTWGKKSPVYWPVLVLVVYSLRH